MPKSKKKEWGECYLFFWYQFLQNKTYRQECYQKYNPRKTLKNGLVNW